MSFRIGTSAGQRATQEDFGFKFWDPTTKLRTWGVSLDIKPTPYEHTIPILADCDAALLGTTVFVDTGRRLLELKSDDGRVVLRNAKMEYLDDNRVRIEFDRSEQL